MANWRKTKYPGIYVAHSKSCPAYGDAGARCRCKPSWRGRAWDSSRKRAVWSRASKSRGEALAWHAAMSKGAEHLAELATLGPTFEVLGEQWLDGVERGHIGRRRGRGKAYSDTTVEGMRRFWHYRLLPEFGPRIAEEISEIDWQRWIDELARTGLSRSTIAKHVSVASGIYAWASAPSRRLVPRNPLRLVELPPNDEKPRLRVALAPEAAALLAALEPEDRLPTRSRSTRACAGARSTGSNGTTSWGPTGSRLASSSAARRARPVRSAARRSPTTSAPCSQRRGSVRAAHAPARSSTVPSCRARSPAASKLAGRPLA
jgi:hypothetical protein